MKELIVGIIQGITEFLPISSSGHMVLAQWLLGVSKPGIEPEIMLHLATLLAVCIFFLKEIKALFVREKITAHPIFLLFVGSIPAGIVGLLFKNQIEAYFENITYLPYFYLITTALLFSSAFVKNTTSRKIDALRAFVIGLAQALAILPGVSRSGATISTALLLGVEPKEAFSFSFLLSIPAILGAVVLDVKNIHPSTIKGLLPAFLAAFVFGLLSLFILGKVLRVKKLYLFGFYTLLLAIILFFIR